MDSSKSGIKLIAELANVSIGTVDRVLHNRPGVAEETRQRVLKIIKELNYQPNIIARRLVSKKVFTLAMLIPAPTQENPFWEKHELGIARAEEEIRPFGVKLDRLLFNQSDVQSFQSQVQKIIAGEYDGVMLVPFFQEECNVLLQHCRSQEIPCVFFDTNLPGAEVSFVGQDAYKSGAFAGSFVNYLMQPQHSVLIININTIKKADNHINHLQREKGFTDQVAALSGFTTKTFNYNKDFKDAAFDEELLHTLKHNPDISVLFVTNSRAYRVAQTLEKHDLRQFRVLGYDLIDPNIHYLKKGYIDFLISQRPVDQGYSGVMLLHKNLILQQPMETQTLMPIDLILKENLEFYNM